MNTVDNWLHVMKWTYSYLDLDLAQVQTEHLMSVGKYSVCVRYQQHECIIK